METIDVRGVRFNDISPDEALSEALSFIKTGGRGDGSSAIIHTPNAEIVQLCVEKPEFYEVINGAELIVPDGSGVILAAKILKRPLKKGKVAGIELCERLIERSGAEGFSVYLLGGKPGVAQTASERLHEKYPDCRIVGTHDGYFGEDSASVIAEINASGADFLAVCLGVPKQELWMREHRAELKVALMGGFGGSLDIFAGNSKRAPRIFIKLGCEWLYRLLKEPRRIGRMMKLPKFILGTIFSHR